VLTPNSSRTKIWFGLAPSVSARIEPVEALGSRSPNAHAMKLLGRAGSGKRGGEQQCGSVSWVLKVRKPLVETRPEEKDRPLNEKLNPNDTRSVAALLCEIERAVALVSESFKKAKGIRLRASRAGAFGDFVSEC